jgi:hypothetical protein
MRRASADELWLYKGSVAKELFDTGLKCNEPLLPVQEDGPARWDWKLIEKLLLKK